MRFSFLFAIIPAFLAKRTIVGYYADWTAAKLPAANIPYAKLTHINYAFAVLDESYTVTFTSQALLKEVVQRAHSHKTKVLLSIGGWSGSKFFSPMVKSKSSRSHFIQQAQALVKQYSLDGIDIDWEFPGRTGLSCNVVDPAHDTGNFLLLLRELRAALGRTKELTLAVRIAPFDGPNGPLNNVSKFGDVVDRINLMAYDINGGWSKTAGPNAPFHGGAESLVGATQAWVKAGFPKSKIAAGLAFYGRSVTLASASASPLGSPIVSTVPKGDSEDAPWADPCPGAQAAMSGVWQWRNLKTEALSDSSWKKGWDNASLTPYLVKDTTFISYDDKRSLQTKANWARCNGLNGVMLWALHNDNGELLDAVYNEKLPCH